MGYLLRRRHGGMANTRAALRGALVAQDGEEGLRGGGERADGGFEAARSSRRPTSSVEQARCRCRSAPRAIDSR